MIPKVHTFEGEQLTVAQIRERVPILGEGAVRSRLSIGLNTRQKMLAYDSRAALQRAGRLGRAVAEDLGYYPKRPA